MKKKKSGGWLYWLFLLVLSLYAYRTCSTDYNLENPLCRTLEFYRSNLVVPPIRSIARHPSVAPHLLRLEPAIHQGIEAYYCVADRTAPYANYLKQQTIQVTGPVWKSQIEPRLRVLNAYLGQHWDTVSSSYEANISPLIAQVGDKMYLVYDKVEPTCTATLRASRPRLEKIFVSVRSLPDVLYQNVYVPAGNARQRYVDSYAHIIYNKFAGTLDFYRGSYIDPHVARLTSRIQQLGSKNLASTSTPTPVSITSVDLPQFTPTPNETVAADAPEPTVPLDEAASSIPAPTTPTILEQSEEAVPTFVTPEEAIVVDETPAVTPEVPIDTISTSSPSQSVVAQETIEISEPEIASPLEEETPPLLTKAVIFDDSATINEPVERASSPPPVTSEAFVESADPEEEYMEFLKELELDFVSDPELAEPDIETPLEQVDDSTKKYRKDTPEETAEKRADITQRHSLWEQRLQDTVNEVKESFFKDLRRHRNNLVKFFKSANGDPFGVNKFQQETTKALRNTESYLKDLSADTKRNIEEKMRLWEKVAARVEDKFNSRIQQIEDEARLWWHSATDQEIGLVRDRYQKLKDKGLQAQADIGMDYAWLDDVSYQDWQRYHALIDGELDAWSVRCDCADLSCIDSRQG